MSRDHLGQGNLACGRLQAGLFHAVWHAGHSVVARAVTSRDRASEPRPSGSGTPSAHLSILRDTSSHSSSPARQDGDNVSRPTREGGGLSTTTKPNSRAASIPTSQNRPPLQPRPRLPRRPGRAGSAGGRQAPDGFDRGRRLTPRSAEILDS